MNLQGSQRGGAKDLALHLLKDENEHVSIHELRGFVSDNLVSALNEAYAISRATKAKQFLFSVSFNPPPQENVSVADFEAAIEKVETHFGLTDQPRVIVFHEKNGRRHCHAVWSRIDTEEMKAIPLPFTRRRLKNMSRELYLEHGWTLPAGYIQSNARDPRNFTLAQWQQAKRAGKDPRKIKAAFQECWNLSDSQNAFQHALSEHGYTLARGDRRGFVAVDHRGEVFSISKKWVGVSANEVRTRLTDEKSLPSVAEARTDMAKAMGQRLNTISQEQLDAFKTRMAALEEKRALLARQHEEERQALLDSQNSQLTDTLQSLQQRFNKGIRGLFDRISGKRKAIEKQNELDALHIKTQQQRENDALIFQQLDTRRALQSRIERLETLKAHRLDELERDATQYRDIREQRFEQFERERREQSRDRPPPRQRGRNFER